MSSGHAQFVLKELKLEVTHECPLACRHCSSQAGTGCGRTMALSDCKRILGEAGQMGVRSVVLSGGEPLVWPGIEAAVDCARVARCDIAIYTTGHCSDGNPVDKLNDLRQRGLGSAVFSLFGSSPERHDKMTRMLGSFQHTCGVIERMAQIGLRTEVHFVPTSENFDDLGAVVDLAGLLGATRVSILRLVPQGRASEDKSLALSPSQNAHLRRSILELQRLGHNLRVGSPYNFLMVRQDPTCHAGIDGLIVGPDLVVSPCDAFKNVRAPALGLPDVCNDLRDHSLEDCWHMSSLLGAVRSSLAAPCANECATCGSLDRCGSGCLAQKFFCYGDLRKAPDPMCLAANALAVNV